MPAWLQSIFWGSKSTDDPATPPQVSSASMLATTVAVQGSNSIQNTYNSIQNTYAAVSSNPTVTTGASALTDIGLGAFGIAVVATTPESEIGIGTALIVGVTTAGAVTKTVQGIVALGLTVSGDTSTAQKVIDMPGDLITQAGFAASQATGDPTYQGIANVASGALSLSQDAGALFSPTGTGNFLGSAAAVAGDLNDINNAFPATTIVQPTAPSPGSASNSSPTPSSNPNSDSSNSGDNSSPIGWNSYQPGGGVDNHSWAGLYQP